MDLMECVAHHTTEGKMALRNALVVYVVFLCSYVFPSVCIQNQVQMCVNICLCLCVCVCMRLYVCVRARVSVCIFLWKLLHNGKRPRSHHRVLIPDSFTLQSSMIHATSCQLWKRALEALQINT